MINNCTDLWDYQSPKEWSFRRVALARGRFMLDSRLCCVQVQAAVLDVLINFPCGLQECFFHAVSSLGRSLNEHEAVFFSKLSCFLICDVSLGFQITFVTNQKYHRVRIS